MDEEEPEVATDGTVEQHRWSRVFVSEIISGSEFFAQVVEGDMEQQLNNLMNNLKLANADGNGNEGIFQPRVGELISARFSQDQQWYRARVRRFNPDKTINVLYVDFGNSENLANTQANIRRLPPQLSGTPALARECRLVFIKVPGADDEYGDDAYDLFRSLTEGKELAVIAFGKPTAKVHEVCLYDPAKVKASASSTEAIMKKSINAEMLREGLGTLTKEANRKLQVSLSTFFSLPS